MPFYNNLNPKRGEDHWTAVGLLRLRRAIRQSRLSPTPPGVIIFQIS
jgi:hypothetical protein